MRGLPGVWLGAEACDEEYWGGTEWLEDERGEGDYTT